MSCTHCGSAETVIYPGDGDEPDVLHCWDCDADEQIR